MSRCELLEIFDKNPVVLRLAGAAGGGSRPLNRKVDLPFGWESYFWLYSFFLFIITHTDVYGRSSIISSAS
jgi:hypothetical protein